MPGGLMMDRTGGRKVRPFLISGAGMGGERPAFRPVRVRAIPGTEWRFGLHHLKAVGPPCTVRFCPRVKLPC